VQVAFLVEVIGHSIAASHIRDAPIQTVVGNVPFAPIAYIRRDVGCTTIAVLLAALDSTASTTLSRVSSAMMPALVSLVAMASPVAECEVRDASMLIPRPERGPCVLFQPRRRMHGVWVDAFEGQSFREGAGTTYDVPERRGNVWIQFQAAARAKLPRQEGSGHAYRIRFLGRKAKDMQRQSLDGYGHFGLSAGLIIVDRLIQIEDLGCVVEIAGKPACLNKPVSP
jgi:hypothetical protein